MKVKKLEVDNAELKRIYADAGAGELDDEGAAAERR